MIPQIASLAPPSLPAPGRSAAAAGVAAGAEESPLALLFGDLLGAMAPEPLPMAEQQGAGLPAGYLTLQAGGLSATDLVAGTGDAAESVPAASELWILLAETGLAAATTTAPGGKALANAPAQSTVPLESRLPAALLASPSADAALVTAAVAEAPEIVRSLISGTSQPALTENLGGSALASTFQAPLPERTEAAPARPLGLPLPLAPQDARAAFTQTLDQVVWMTREGVHQARLQLEPAHLGRVDIWLDLEGGEAKLHLGAQQVQVREALEAVLPRLRDALAQHGMSLTDASVSDSGRQQPEYSDSREPAASGPAAGDDPDRALEDRAELPSGTLPSSGLLDLYA